MTINDLININPVTKTEQITRRRKVRNRFGAYLPAQCPEPWDLMLYPFTATVPLKYFNFGNAIRLGIFLERHRDTVLDALREFDNDFSHAVATLLQPSTTLGLEGKQPLNSAKEYSDISKIWHPEYQRYVEHAYGHLINIPLHVLEVKNSKQYCNQALAKKVEFLTDDLKLPFLAWGYRQIVRNAISHGRVRFVLAGIEYQDVTLTGELKKEVLANRELRTLFDNLVASCNEICVALILFLLHHWKTVEARGLENLSRGLLHLALTGVGTNQTLTISHLFESDLGPNQKQLNLTCSTKIVSRLWQTYTALNLTSLVQDLSSSRYQRLAISFDCGRSLEPMIIINAKRLHEARKQNGEANLSEIIESNLLWYDTPRWYLGLINRWTIYRAVFNEAWEKYFEDIAKKGIVPLYRLYKVKSIIPVGASKGVGVEAKVVLKDNVLQNRQTLRAITNSVLWSLRLRMFRKDGLGRKELRPRWPSYIRIYIYPQDDILRNLQGRIKDGALLEAEWDRGNGQFIYVRMPHEIIGGAKIRYGDHVLLNEKIKDALDTVANDISTTHVIDADTFTDQIAGFISDIRRALKPEPVGIQKFWLYREIKRYSDWITILRPTSQLVMKTLIEKKGAVTSDGISALIDNLMLPTNEGECNLSDMSVLVTLMSVLFGQHLSIGAIKEIVADDAAFLQRLNDEFHRVLRHCTETNVDVRTSVRVSSKLRFTLEDVLYELAEKDQIKFYKTELGKTIEKCMKLMPTYRVCIFNGADEVVTSELEEAKKHVRLSPPNLDDLRSSYLSLVDAPYSMESAISNFNQ